MYVRNSKKETSEEISFVRDTRLVSILTHARGCNGKHQQISYIKSQQFICKFTNVHTLVYNFVQNHNGFASIMLFFPWEPRILSPDFRTKINRFPRFIFLYITLHALFYTPSQVLLFLQSPLSQYTFLHLRLTEAHTLHSSAVL